jgi:fructose-1,6-bisphosphatase I
MYPSTTDAPNGKLRLLYECNPLAMISEQAGDKASDGHINIVDIMPKTLHQRVPLYIGTASMVTEVEGYLSK